MLGVRRVESGWGQIFSKLKIKSLNKCQWRLSSVFILNFEHIVNSNIFRVINIPNIDNYGWTIKYFDLELFKSWEATEFDLNDIWMTHLFFNETISKVDLI